VLVNLNNKLFNHKINSVGIYYLKSKKCSVFIIKNLVPEDNIDDNIK